MISEVCIFPAIVLFRLFLAESPGLPPADFGLWWTNLIYLFGTIFFILGGVEKWKRIFGRNPPIDHVIDQVKIDISGLVSKTEWEKQVETERLRDKGLEEQISRVRHSLPTIEQARQACDDELRDEFTESLKELSEAMNAGFAKVQEKITAEFKELDNKRSTSVGRIHGDMGALRDRVSAVESTATSLNQSQHAQDQRIDALRRPRSS